MYFIYMNENHYNNSYLKCYLSDKHKCNGKGRHCVILLCITTVLEWFDFQTSPKKKDIVHNLQGDFKFYELLHYVKSNPDCVKFPSHIEKDMQVLYPFDIIPETESIDFVHNLKNENKESIFFISEDLDKCNIILEQRKDPALADILFFLT